MMYQTIMMIVVIIAVHMSGSGVALGFVDPLDNPALKSPYIDRLFFNGVARAGDRVVCVGQRGYIAYSDDKGASWTQADVVPVDSDLVAVNFPTPKKGWAVGHDGVVLHSADGGITWSKQLDGRIAVKLIDDYYIQNHPKDMPGGNQAGSRFIDNVNIIVKEGPDKPFLDVWFESETTGFVVGTFNLLFRTIDGGKSWVPWLDRADNLEFLHLYSIRTINQDLFIAGEQGILLKLDRRAERFLSQKTPQKGSFFGIRGSSKVIIAFGLQGNAVRSLDGGVHWQKVETGVVDGLIGGTVTEDGRIVLTSQRGDLLISSDNGASFNKTNIAFPATAVETLDKDTLMFTGLIGLKVQKLKQ